MFSHSHLDLIINDVPHRPPPGIQGSHERWSLVFFTRPGNSVVLRALVEDSPMIAEAVAKTPEKNFETGSTSFEWFSRRIRNQRIKNRKVSILCLYTNIGFHSSDLRGLKLGWRVVEQKQIPKYKRSYSSACIKYLSKFLTLNLMGAIWP